MSRRSRPMAVFLMMLWLPPLLLFVSRMAGCFLVAPGLPEANIHAPAPEAGHSARDAEGVFF